MFKLCCAAILGCTTLSVAMAASPFTPSALPVDTKDVSGQVISTQGKLSSHDFKFAEDASSTNIAEIAMGKLAATQGQSEDVKKFGQQMVDDHSAANKELLQLLQSKGAAVTEEMTKMQVEHQDKMAKYQGADFDKAYIKMMVKGHKAALDEFQKAADKSDDADIKAYAAKYVPIIQNHLQMAENIQKTLDNATASNK